MQFPAERTLVEVLRVREIQEAQERARVDDSGGGGRGGGRVQRLEGLVRVPGGKGGAGTLEGVGWGMGVGGEGVEVVLEEES